MILQLLVAFVFGCDVDETLKADSTKALHTLSPSEEKKLAELEAKFMIKSDELNHVKW